MRAIIGVLFGIFAYFFIILTIVGCICGAVDAYLQENLTGILGCSVLMGLAVFFLIVMIAGILDDKK